MRRVIYLCLGLVTLAALSSCSPAAQRPSPTASTEQPVATEQPTMPGMAATTYTSSEHQLAFTYPAGWIIERDGYQEIVLVPADEQDWQPSTPGEIAKDPHVSFELGNYIREKRGPAIFPAQVDPQTLRAWLEQSVQDGEARDLSDLSIDGIQGFALVEAGISGCTQVVYWRPESLERLVRVSTGCESSYLPTFEQIVGSLLTM